MNSSSRPQEQQVRLVGRQSATNGAGGFKNNSSSNNSCSSSKKSGGGLLLVYYRWVVPGALVALLILGTLHAVSLYQEMGAWREPSALLSKSKQDFVSRYKNGTAGSSSNNTTTSGAVELEENGLVAAAAAAKVTDAEPIPIPESSNYLCQECKDTVIVDAHLTCIQKIQYYIFRRRFLLNDALATVSKEFNGECAVCSTQECWLQARNQGVAHPLVQALLKQRKGHDQKDKKNAIQHKLRHDWKNMSLYTPMARRLAEHQQNCTIPLRDYRHRSTCDGMGSDLHVWLDALAEAMVLGKRVRTFGDWNWAFRDVCPSRVHMACYFPQIEFQCPIDTEQPRSRDPVVHYIKVNYTNVKRGMELVQARSNAEYYAAGIEFLFSQVGVAVVQEAERQLNIVFPDGVPPNLVLVHIRWGDKLREMKLQSVDEHAQGVQKMLKDNGLPIEHANVYLATEDPLAVQYFLEAALEFKWNVFVDHYFLETAEKRVEEYNNHCRQSRVEKGKPGLVTLASLLVAMEADYYVLSFKSNWSRLMNEIRKNILDSKCQNCTRVINQSGSSTELQ